MGIWRKKPRGVWFKKLGGERSKFLLGLDKVVKKRNNAKKSDFRGRGEDRRPFSSKKLKELVPSEGEVTARRAEKSEGLTMLDC